MIAWAKVRNKLMSQILKFKKKQTTEERAAEQKIGNCEDL